MSAVQNVNSAVVKENTREDAVSRSSSPAACPVQDASMGIQKISLPELDSSENRVMAKQSLYFEELPQIVMIKIFGYLTIVDRLRTERVSKFWQRYVDKSLRLETHLSERQLFKKNSRINFFLKLGDDIGRSQRPLKKDE